MGIREMVKAEDKYLDQNRTITTMVGNTIIAISKERKSLCLLSSKLGLNRTCIAYIAEMDRWRSLIGNVER